MIKIVIFLILAAVYLMIGALMNRNDKTDVLTIFKILGWPFMVINKLMHLRDK